MINNIQSSYQFPYVQQTNTLEKIAALREINSAADNPASLAISDALRTQASGYSASIDNALSASSSVQIADRALSEQSNILDKVKEKLVQASTSTTSQEGREAIMKDIQGLMKNFDNIAEVTNYAGDNLLQYTSDDSSSTTQKSYQVGNNDGDTITLDEIQSNSEGVGLDSLLTLDPSTFSAGDAKDYLSKVDDALTNVNDFRTTFGSVQNELLSATRNLTTQETQTRSAEYELTAANVAEQISNLSKQNIVSQAVGFGISQANVNQQSVLRLLT